VEKNDMNELKTKYTFWKLINQYKIEIPIMQRDYAQGRTDDRTNSIRAELIDTLFHSVVDNFNIDFDFVYGTVKDEKLLPIDGQQRLTTLFLLHWYIAMKEGRLTDEVSEILDKFTYSTRISSREFCHALVNFDFDLERNTKVSEVIKDSNWCFRLWDKDPTIKAMLVMIDDIHTKFFDTEGLFDKLVKDIDENPPITFSFISLDDYSLTDDLYIKMNERGKPLSDFENFKAKFMQYLKNQRFDYKHFEDSIDNKWTDLLWEYRSKNNTIDEAFIRFFMFITEMIYTEDAEAKDMNSPYRIFNFNIFIKTYDSNEKVQRLYEMLDLWSSKDEIGESMKSIFSSGYEEGKTRLFESNYNLMDQCLKGDNLSFPNKVLLYMVMRRLAYYKKQGKTDNGINDYARVIRNLVSRVRTLTGLSYQSDFRYGRHAIPFVQFIAENLLSADYVYKVLPSLKAPTAVREENLKDEKDKAKLINEDEDNKIKIQNLEDLDIFKGSIHNVIGLLEDSKEDYTEMFKSIFSKDNTTLVTRALLSIADYGIKLGGSALGDRVYFGTKGNWYTILTSKRDDSYAGIFYKLITQYNKTTAKNVQGKLIEIIDANSKSMGKRTWRYYFVKYPRMLGKLNMLYAFKNRAGNNVKIHRMDGSTLNGYHIVPFYREIAFQLGNEKCDLDSCRGINSEEGAIVLKCGVSVGQEDDGSWLITNIADEAEDTVDEVIDKFNSIAMEQLDYVEQGVILCTMLHESLKKDE
jgi:uncharacterized protein with ParB-like and HNH nuclease domain